MYSPGLPWSMSLTDIPRDVTEQLSAMAGVAGDRWAPDYDPTAGPLRRAGQTGTIISVVVIGVVALVGILIFAQIQAALPDTSNTELQNASDEIVSGFGSALELIPIVMLVLVAALVIGVVQRMRMT